MERKTKIHAEDGKQDLVITREFDLPLELLFRAYTEPEIIEQWMGTKVLKLENQRHGGWQFQTSDPQGNVLFGAHGVIHEFIPNRKITRTFEMENVPFDTQLEFMDFEELSPERSKFTMQIVYRSAELREQQLKLPFSYGINMAHDQLQEIANTLK